MNRHPNRIAACLTCAVLIAIGPAMAEEKVIKEGDKPAVIKAVESALRPQPKPLSENVKKGLEWLVKNQLDNGSWAQGEESAEMGTGMAKIKSTPNVADTCMATMALFRSGSTAKEGTYKDNVLKAVKFVCAQIEESDANSLSITTLQGTRTQAKLGTYIDTFMAAQVLAELKGSMPDEATTKRVEAALAKVVRKMELNQKQDGRWTNEGWAPTLAQAQASKALNSVVMNGGDVSEKVRERAEKVARDDFKTTKGGTVASSDSAGVVLYSAGGQIASIQASATVNDGMRDKLEAVVSSATSQPEQKALAVATLKRFDENEKDLKAAQESFIARMDDKQFISGFGSNGGEEFLSYLNIGESLILRGGKEWEKWDKSITDNLNRVQNQDGSWTGHHCITGRTFCTSAAMMVLTIDRSPAPAATKIKEAKK